MAYIFDASKGETPETVAKKRELAAQLTARIFGRAPQNFGEGLNALGQAWIARSMMGEADEAAKAGRAAGMSTYERILAGITGGTPTGVTPNTTGAPAAPSVVPPAPGVPTDATPPPFMGSWNAAGATPIADPSATPPGNQTFAQRWDGMNAPPENTAPIRDVTMAMARSPGDPNKAAWPAAAPSAAPSMIADGGRLPRGIRNNNPLNIEAGGFTQGLPGYTGSDGRFARFETPDQGVAAADRLLKTYSTKYGLNTVAGIINRWAPASDGNNVSAYAQAVAKGLGVSPTQPLNMDDPNVRLQLVQYMGQHENGRPIPMPGQQFAQAPAATIDDASIPANAMPASGTLPTQEQVSGKPLPGGGLSLQQLMAAAGDPWLSEGQRAVVTSLLSQKLEEEKQARDPLRQAQTKLAIAKAEKAAAGGEVEYGLNPIYGKTADGKEGFGVVGKDGTFKLIDTKGFEPSSGVDKIDMGTQFMLRDKKSGNIVGYVPKDIAGREREEKIGQAQGASLAAAPSAIQAGQNALGYLDKIEKHPYLDRGTGATSLGNKIPGTGGYDFQNLVEGAKSGAFLQAIEQMRGLGSLSNAEGQAATAAINRMNTATSKEAFLDAVKDYRTIVQQGIAKADGRLKNPTAVNPTPTAAPANKSGGKTTSGVSWSIE